MTWKMEVRKDEPVPPGWHEGECRKVEDMDTTFGMRLRLTHEDGRWAARRRDPSLVG